MTFNYRMLYILNRYHRLLIVLFVLFILYVVYRIYRMDIYLWSCESEKINSSCAIVGILSLELGDEKNGIYYLKESCNMKYGLGCSLLGDFYIKKGLTPEANRHYKLACELDYRPACDK